MLSQQWRFLTTINNDVTTSGTMDIVVFRVGKVRFSGTRKFVFLKASSEERCAPHNFVLLVTLRGTRVRLIFYVAVHQMK